MKLNPPHTATRHIKFRVQHKYLMQIFQILGKDLIICINKYHKLPICQRESAISCLTIARISGNINDYGMFQRQPLKKCKSVIRGFFIICKDYFKIGVCLTKKRSEKVLNIWFCVVYRNNYTDEIILFVCLFVCFS